MTSAAWEFGIMADGKVGIVDLSHATNVNFAELGINLGRGWVAFHSHSFDYPCRSHRTVDLYRATVNDTKSNHSAHNQV